LAALVISGTGKLKIIELVAMMELQVIAQVLELAHGMVVVDTSYDYTIGDFDGLTYKAGIRYNF
jgi:hypothetical protein